MLTACGAKSQTFHFDSNMSNVEIMNEEGSCYAPCKLKLTPDSLNSTFMIRDHNYSRHGAVNVVAHGFDENWDEDFFEFHVELINPFDEELHLVYAFTLGTVFTTVSAISTLQVISLPITTTADLTTGTKNFLEYAIATINYDTNAYYIYISESESSIFADPDFLISQYVLTNFEQMQAELFVTKQPFIAGLTELIASSYVPNDWPYERQGWPMPNIEELLLASTDVASFLNALIKSDYRTEPMRRD
jgi:hypothetical protein